MYTTPPEGDTTLVYRSCRLAPGKRLYSFIQLSGVEQIKCKKCIRWCLHDTGISFIPVRPTYFIPRLHIISHSGIKLQ